MSGVCTACAMASDGEAVVCDHWIEARDRYLNDTPADLLIDLLVERGVLAPVTLPHGNHTISVYQRKDT